jgi:hypothetical protein
MEFNSSDEIYICEKVSIYDSCDVNIEINEEILD